MCVVDFGVYEFLRAPTGMCRGTCMCAPDSVCVHVCVCVFAFVFQEERVVPDRAESSQPISQHHCDIDLSAHRR